LTDQRYAKLREQLRAFAGEERYRRFVFDVQGWRLGEGRLFWWQERLLDNLTKKTEVRFPENFDELRAIFVNEFPVLTLSVEEVPGWCQIEELSIGQAWGKCDGFRWYFSCKYGSWNIALATDPSVDPVMIDDETGGFYREELYGSGTGGGTWIPDEEARYNIVESLKQFRELQSDKARGQDNRRWC
jgi:hypothetical protein